MRLISYFFILFSILSNIGQARPLVVTHQEATKLKVVPQFGVVKLKNDYFSFKSSLRTGVSLDFLASKRVSVGTSFIYSQFNLENDSYFNNFTDTDFYQYHFNIYSKIFFIPYGVVRPFFSTGLGYAHNVLEYGQYNGYFSNSSSGTDLSLSFGTITATMSAGTEIRLSRNIGLQFDARYDNYLSSGLNRKYQTGYSLNNPAFSYDYGDLEQLALDLEDSHLLSFNVGLAISF